jgi:hypothetical protein
MSTLTIARVTPESWQRFSRYGFIDLHGWHQLVRKPLCLKIQQYLPLLLQQLL